MSGLLDNGRIPVRHRLKIERRWYDRLADGTKTCEVRKDDRDYQIGDTIVVGICPSETDTAPDYSRDGGVCARAVGLLTFEITHVLRGGQYGIDPGWVVLSLHRARR